MGVAARRFRSYLEVAGLAEVERKQEGRGHTLAARAGGKGLHLDPVKCRRELELTRGHPIPLLIGISNARLKQL
jgi:hypothetical protein